ncbi:MAG: transglutaminase domain-containing protein [Clostridia bacterium]|nr:transglutaminase domain-containing protein [Clostridia bacterium]
MKRIIKYLLLLTIFVLAITISVTAYAATYNVDTSNLTKGIISVNYSSDTGKKYMLKIAKGDEKVFYSLTNNLTDSFSLTFGNGDYDIKIMMNTTGISYTSVYAVKVNLSVSDSESIYLNSIQNVKWNENMDSIDYAEKIVYETVESLIQKARLYELIIFNYSYDSNKYSNVKNASYLPVIDDTFHSQMGICYDFSSLLAGMLRSQGVPTKLVTGYASYTTEYHAWNEVLINGKWMVIDTTYDAYYVKKGKEVEMFKDPSIYTKVYEY